MKLRLNQKGFTLLEVMIAFALLTGIMFIAVISQSSSMVSSTRSKHILVATNLARNMMNELEVKYEDAPFDQLPKEEKGDFDGTNKGYSWTVEFAEVDFGVLSDVIAKQAEADKKEEEAHTETLVKMFEDYLKKSVRKMKLTIEYPDGEQTGKLSFTQLLVKYDADFAATL